MTKEQEDVIILYSGLLESSRKILSIVDSFIKRDENNTTLNELKQEIEDYIDKKEKEFNSHSFEVTKDNNEISNIVDYSYSGEIIKIYNSKISIGLTIKAEYIGETLTDLDGFYLDFENMVLEDISEQIISENYSFIKQGYKNEDEKVVIYTFQNKDLCNMRFEEIRENFIDKKKIAENEKILSERKNEEAQEDEEL